SRLMDVGKGIQTPLSQLERSGIALDRVHRNVGVLREELRGAADKGPGLNDRLEPAHSVKVDEDELAENLAIKYAVSVQQLRAQVVLREANPGLGQRCLDLS